MRVRVPMACSVGCPKLGSSREGRTTLPLPLMRRRPIRTRDPAGAMPCVYMSVACMNSSSKRTTSPSSTRAASLQGWLCFEPIGSHSCQGRENMAYRHIRTETDILKGSEFFNGRHGNDKVIVLSPFSDSSGNHYVAFELCGRFHVVTDAAFRKTYFEKSLHTLERGDIFLIDTDTAKGSYFLVLSDDQDESTVVLRIGRDSEGSYWSHIARGIISYYVSALSNGYYSKIKIVGGLASRGYKITDLHS